MGGNLRKEDYKTFEHTTAYVVTLMLQHFEIFLYCVKFSLKNLLLHLRRLWYLAELVVRHENLMFNTRHDRVAGLGNSEGSQRALNLLYAIRTIEERHAVVSLETLFIGKQYPGIGIGTLIGHGYLCDIGFKTDNHRFVSQSKTLHFMAGKCEYCGAEENLKMVHIRKLKDLEGKQPWEKLMIARKRKTMAVCECCLVYLRIIFLRVELYLDDRVLHMLSFMIP